MDTGINVLETPEKMPLPHDLPDLFKEEQVTGLFEYPIKILKEAIAHLQSQKYKNTLSHDIDYLSVKLGLKKQPNNMNEFQNRELALRNEVMTTGKQLTQKDLTERYNLLVDYYKNNENNIASVQMAIENLLKNT